MLDLQKKMADSSKLILSLTLDKTNSIALLHIFRKSLWYEPVSYDPLMVVSDDTVHIGISHCFHARL